MSQFVNTFLIKDMTTNKGEFTMSVINRKGADKLRAEVLGIDTATKGEKMARSLLDDFNQFHSLSRVKEDKEIEMLLVQQRLKEIEMIDAEPTYPKDKVKFNPSGASKTIYDLYLKGMKVEEKEERYPYHQRWTRNSTAIHGATQRDLLYMEKVLPNPSFTVERTEEGLPAWEDNILQWKELEHEGVSFILNGKMDGILVYKDGTRVGFEFKTKSNSIGQVGYYKMREVIDSHVKQCISYYLLFGIRDYIVMYEGVAKDQWSKGAEAKPDIRTFHLYITDEMAEEILDKFATVTKHVEDGIEPADKELSFFSGYKYLLEATEV
ncbi:hypothetical protein ACRV5I_20310 [Bacillus halotolerans]|uniref:hypothetical protein n=2 Tax=Bacillus subtilis group TaxID=653685 RepID=UPI003EB75DE7